jgi:hypothetical protein
MQTIKLTAAALTLSLLAGALAPAMAQQGGVSVGGNATNTTLVNQNTNAAIGLGASASSRIGSVQSSTIGGNLVNTSLVNQNTNAAIGLGSKAQTQLGAVTGAKVGGNLVQTTLVNQNTNAAIGLGAKAGSAIGTVSHASVGGNLTNTTLVNQNTNAAIGLGTKACSEIGSDRQVRRLRLSLPSLPVASPTSPAAPRARRRFFVAAQRLRLARSIALAASAAICPWLWRKPFVSGVVMFMTTVTGGWRASRSRVPEPNAATCCGVSTASPRRRIAGSSSGASPARPPVW